MRSAKRNTRKHRKQSPHITAGKATLSHILMRVGVLCIVLGVAVTFAMVWPLIRLELGYSLRQTFAPARTDLPQEPIDTEFGVVIPKIQANAKVIRDVDPFDSAVYQRALTKGVAHAKGSAFPGDGRNIFLFSHSSVNLVDALRYNSVFYLLSKLTKGDSIYVYYRSMRYTYTVADVRKVPADAINYLFRVPETETVTLMTCWPPGTSAQRLIVIAERQP